MILCDIGNTNATFYENGKIQRVKIADFLLFKPTQKIYYISVNDRLKEHLDSNSFFINLEPFFSLNTNYKGLGIDRIAACASVDSGVLVDAGSAITIDVMQNKKHMGGFILPGISRQLETYASISPRLKISINSKIDLSLLPQSTADAVSYGIISPIICAISNAANNEKIYFTGGDGEFLSRYFKNAIFDKMLVFRSMQKLIKQKGLNK